MIKGELAAAADMVYSFESDSHLNPYIKEILVTAGYWSFDFLPPIGDEAWERNISKVLTQPMMEHVQNRVRQRNQQSRDMARINALEQQSQKNQDTYRCKISELEQRLQTEVEMWMSKLKECEAQLELERKRRASPPAVPRSPSDNGSSRASKGTSERSSPAHFRSLSVPHLSLDSPGLGSGNVSYGTSQSGFHASSRPGTPLRARGRMDMTPDQLTQHYVDFINTHFGTPERCEYRVVRVGASVQLQQRDADAMQGANATKPSLYSVLYDTNSLNPSYARNMLMALDKGEWCVPSFLALLVEGQLPPEVTADYPQTITRPDLLSAIKMLRDKA